MSGKYQIKRVVTALLVAAVTMSFGSTASATILGVADTNRTTLINTGIPAVVSSNPNDKTFRLWDEQQDFVLTEDVLVDLLASTGEAGMILDGTVVSSHMLQWDGLKKRATRISAEVEFSDAILGVATSRGTLLASDFLGRDAVTYLDFHARGLEEEDSVWLLDDGNTLGFWFNAPDPGDWIRVITASPVIIEDPDETPGDDEDPDDTPDPVTEVPAPAALPAGLAMIVAMAARRRRR